MITNVNPKDEVFATLDATAADGPLGGAQVNDPPWTESYNMLSKDVFALANIGLEMVATCLILLFEEKGPGRRVFPILITLMSIASTFYSLFEWLCAREEGWIRVHPSLRIYLWRNGSFLTNFQRAPSVVFSFLRLGCCITRMIHSLTGYSEADLFIALLSGCFAILEAYHGMVVRHYLTLRA